MNSESSLTKVNTDIAALYDQVDRGDAAPTPAQIAATREIAAGFDLAIKRWQEFLTKDVPAINQQLHDVNLPEIRIEAHPKTEEEPEGDEE